MLSFGKYLAMGASILLLASGCAQKGEETSADSSSVALSTVPAVTLRSDLNTVAQNGGVTLSWSGTNVDSCMASGDWSGGRATSGSATRSNLTSDKTYILTCSGAAGSVSDSVSVTVVAPSTPVVNITANPQSVSFDGSTQLQWSSSNVDTCTASGNWSGSRNASGSSNRNNLTSDRTYILTCSGAGGSASDSVTVSVGAAPPAAPEVTLSANTTSVVSGDPITLSWSSTNADGCIASGDWSGSLGTSGSMARNNLLNDQTYTLTCNGPGGSANDSVSVIVTSGSTNTAPIADAGVDQYTTTGELIMLDGSGSDDPDGDPLSYAWTFVNKPAGSTSVLNNSASAQPTFVADMDGLYELSLIVNDGSVDSGEDRVSIVSSDSSFDCTLNTIHCVDDTSGPNQEFSVIQNAVNISQPGDVVLVFDGNYAGFRVSSDGTAAQPIRVVAQSIGANIVSSEPFGQNAIRIQNSSYVSIEGFRIDGSGFSTGSNYDYACIAARGANTSSPMRSLRFIGNQLNNCKPAGMYLSNARDIQIIRNVIRNSIDVNGIQGMGIYLANAAADNAYVVENIISGSEDVAIHMNGDSSVGGDGIQTGHQILRNVFEGNGTNGLNMDGVQDVLVENNIFANNGKHGIRGYRIDGSGGPRNWVIVNNTFYNNESAGKASEDLGGHIIFNNVIVDNTNNSFLMSASNYAASNNLFTTDQNSVFVGASSDDFRLNPGSSAVNGGTASFMGIDAPADDLSATARSAIPDMGAFESGSSYPDWYQ